MNKRILVVSTYPIKNAQHGGQKRLKAIVEAYKQSFQFVEHVGVFYKGFYKDFTSQDIVLGQQSVPKVQQSPYTGDIVCGEAIYDDPEVKQKMTQLLQRFQPTIVHLEQPFAYIGLKKLLTELNMHPKLIFGSQNIEAPMKRDILENAGTPQAAVEEAVKLIDELERELSTEAVLTIACTNQDLQKHMRMGAKHGVLAQNGIAPIETDQESLDHWRNEFAASNAHKTVLFVASAHPPSWTGFLDMVGLGVGFMGFSERLLLAGSVSDYFEQNIHEVNNIEHATFWQRVLSCGRLSDERLGALLTLADVIILPITEGGGSNLKTAEALTADKPIVATSHAFRSYEQFQNFPNVYIADTPDAFRSAITTALNSEVVPRTRAQQKEVKAVLWENRFKDLVKEVSKL